MSTPPRNTPTTFFGAVQVVLERLVRWLAALRNANLAGFIFCMLATPGLAFLPFTRYLQSDWSRLAILCLAAMAGSIFLYAWAQRHSRSAGDWVVYFSISLTLAAVVYVALSYAQDISTYPLTLTWSETSRYYYASLFFAKRIYGVDAPPTVLHPSRYLLQAIPFIIADTPLWLHRAWQALLWVTLPALTAWLLAKRMALSNPFLQWMLAGAAFLYLMIGPVYYHLLVPIILMLWGFSTPMKFAAGSNWIRSLILLFMASAWAGISRVNWYPVPGLLAAALIFLEEPIQHTDASDRPFFGLNAAVWRYLLKAALLTVLGAGAALLAQIAYISWSGNQAEQFTTSFTSDLLWSRLLPNPTFAPGILLGIVLVSLPAALIVVGKLLQPFHGAPMLRRVHPLRLLGLMGILLVLLIGGLVVSVKIGGGSNLHNMDAYLVLLVVICASVFSDRLTPDFPADAARSDFRLQLSNRLLQSGLALVILMGTAFTVAPRAPSAPLPDRAQAERGAATIVEAAQAVGERGGQVLFISNRHLLTFHQIRNVALIPDYERVFLMEVAMAGDAAYLTRFYNDLKNHRFALIVSEPLSRQQKGGEGVFGAENDAWVKRVSRYVLCYYEPVKTLRAVQVQLLAPRAAPEAGCP